MVGFPGESDYEFRNTFDFLRESPLTYFHVFPYSARRGTAAYDMPNKVPVEITKMRSRTLRDLGIEKKRKFYRRFIGQKIPVIVEKGSKGTSRNYISVLIPHTNLKIGHEFEVEIKDVIGEHAIGLHQSH